MASLHPTNLFRLDYCRLNITLKFFLELQYDMKYEFLLTTLVEFPLRQTYQLI